MTAKLPAFERDTALARAIFIPDMGTSARGEADIVYNSELGNASVATVKAKSIKPGTVMVETLHTADCLLPSA